MQTLDPFLKQFFADGRIALDAGLNGFFEASSQGLARIDRGPRY